MGGQHMERSENDNICPPLFPARPHRPPASSPPLSFSFFPSGAGQRAAGPTPRGFGAGGISGPPVGRGARTLGGAGGGGDSGREPGPSRGSPQLRRASRPLPGSPAGAGAGPLPAGPRSTPPSPLPRCVAGAGGRPARVGGTSASVFPRRVRPPGRGFPRGASPRPAPSSRLRTGADQGNPTV